MADIIHFPQDENLDLAEDPGMAQDTFLVEEGLDLLAAYRAINDPDVRASIMQLVKSLSGGRRVSNGR